MIDIIIPTKKISPFFKESIDSLKYLPFPYKFHLITEGRNWPEAVNIGFKESDNDVLLMDDDTVLKPDTFKNFKPLGDITGFKLRLPDGRIQHAGGEIINVKILNSFADIIYKGGRTDLSLVIGHCFEDITKPRETSHCTASLLYIKKEVWQKLNGISTDYPGYQYEDLDFSFRALKEGFKIVCLPNEAIHHEGATKSQDPNFQKGVSINFEKVLKNFFNGPEFFKLLYEKGFLIFDPPEFAKFLFETTSI